MFYRELFHSILSLFFSPWSRFAALSSIACIHGFLQSCPLLSQWCLLSYASLPSEEPLPILSNAKCFSCCPGVSALSMLLVSVGFHHSLTKSGSDEVYVFERLLTLHPSLKNLYITSFRHAGVSLMWGKRTIISEILDSCAMG